MIYYLVRLVSFFRNFIIFICLYPFLKNKQSENIIISERGVDARDNGYVLFKYIRENFPSKKVFYIIDKKSEDYNKIKKLGNIILYRSIQHHIYFITAKIRISTHVMGYSPDSGLFRRIYKFFNLKGKNVFLQHGIIINALKGLDSNKLDLFICGAFPEYEYIKSRYNFDKDVVKYTGLARFDNLHNCKTKNQILIMPTWRIYLKHLSKKAFVKTEYYNYWNCLLNNNNLHEFLTSNNFTLFFYPHFEMQKFISLFNVDCNNIVIANKNQFDVQQLLIDSRLLVTDYSSVFFDFAYMKKPIIFYQFDKYSFRKKHYGKSSYFDYEKTEIGKVIGDEENVVKEIIRRHNENYALNQNEKNIISDFFKLDDNKNCERIYNLISKL